MPDRTSRPQMFWAGLSSSGIQATTFYQHYPNPFVHSSYAKKMYLKETIVFSAAEAPDNISVLSWCHVKKNKDSEDGG